MWLPGLCKRNLPTRCCIVSTAIRKAMDRPIVAAARTSQDNSMHLNENAARLCDQIVDDAMWLKVRPERNAIGTLVVDFGIDAPGGLEAGRVLAEVCLAGLGRVQLIPGEPSLWPGPCVAVTTDHPVAACMASQYAGWQISGDDYFAIGSGPMRAAAGRESLYEKIGNRETSPQAVGVLESGSLPPAEVCVDIAAACQVPPDQLTLLVAPTASLAGTVQVVARSVEMAMHKLHELDFDLHRIVSGFGTTPLPPTAADDLAGIGRTNDAVIYGSQVALWLRGDDASLEQIGPRVPSSAQPDHGEPFAKIFARYHHDFYQIDPLLFSPAVVTLHNLETGNRFQFGHTSPEVLKRSFST